MQAQLQRSSLLSGYSDRLTVESVSKRQRTCGSRVGSCTMHEAFSCRDENVLNHRALYPFDEKQMLEGMSSEPRGYPFGSFLSFSFFERDAPAAILRIFGDARLLFRF